jgi:hypothetical protein
MKENINWMKVIILGVIFITLLINTQHPNDQEK